MTRRGFGSFEDDEAEAPIGYTRRFVDKVLKRRSTEERKRAAEERRRLREIQALAFPHDRKIVREAVNRKLRSDAIARLRERPTRDHRDLTGRVFGDPQPPQRGGQG